MRELGELLRKAREARGLAISDVQEATKIRSRYLEAIEQGDFEALPGEVYVKGFLRNYAEAVGLCGDEVVARYKAERARIEVEKAREASPDKGRDVSKKARIPRHLLIAVGTVAVVAVVVGATVWRHGHVPAGPAEVSGAQHVRHAERATDVATGDALVLSEDQALPEARPEEVAPEAGLQAARKTTSQPAPTTSPPSPARPATQEGSAVAEGHELSVSITERCWVRVVADGKVVFERSMLAGEQATWRARESIRIKVGNASGIDVTYNGVHIGVLGKPGQVVERSFPEN